MKSKVRYVVIARSKESGECKSVDIFKTWKTAETVREQINRANPDRTATIEIGFEGVWEEIFEEDGKREKEATK